MRAAYPEKHTKRVRRSSAADLFCMRQVSGAGPDGPRRPARFTMPGMNALARLRPGSSCCLPAGVARQRKGTKRIMAPAAQGPRPSAVHLPRHAAIPFAPCTGADAETPLTASQLFTGALDQRGRKRKTADSGGKAVRIVFCLRLGKKIPAPHSPAMACTAFRGLAWRRE